LGTDIGAVRFARISALLLACAARDIHAQCADGSPPPCRAVALRAPAPASNSIAVLYFDNLSRDSAHAYLAEGLTEELISRLAQVERLQVKSRTAVRAMRGSQDDPGSIGRRLGVAQLLSGSVLPARGRVRVNVELTRVVNGNTVWARSFDRPAEDLLSVQAEIAESIAVRLGGSVAQAERQRIAARPTTNPAAYDHMLRGRFEGSRRTQAAMVRAIAEYEAALRLDSTATLALVGVTQLYSALATLYYDPSLGISRDSLRTLGRHALQRAIRLDSLSPLVLVARASSLERPGMNRIWLKQAAQLDPRNADVQHALGLTLRLYGDDAGAIAAFQKAIALEPDRAISLTNLGQTLMVAGRFAEARIWMDSAVALRPEAYFYYLNQGYLLFQLGDTAGARRAAAESERRGGVGGAANILARIDARAGDTASARARLRPIVEGFRTRDCEASHDCLELAFTLAEIGERQEALGFVDRLRATGAWLAYWLTRPEFAPIRSEPRYVSALDQARGERDRLLRNP
jgi:TolB-like protein/Tfp pilus assembly protein PilF